MAEGHIEKWGYSLPVVLPHELPFLAKTIIALETQQLVLDIRNDIEWRIGELGVDNFFPASHAT